MLTEQRVKKKRTQHMGATRRPPKGHQLIVEFTGPTGCGKSTNCIFFAELLNNAGLKTYVFKDVKSYLYQLPFFQRVYLYSATVLKSLKDLLAYSWLLNTNRVLSADGIGRFIRLRIFQAATELFMTSRTVDVLLLDQWMVQGLWSATIFRGAIRPSLEHGLMRFYAPVSYLLYFDTDEETACERMDTRGSRRSRFDRMDRVTRRAELKRYTGYLRQLYEHSPCPNKLVFSTNVDPKENAAAFLKCLHATPHKEN